MSAFLLYLYNYLVMKILTRIYCENILSVLHNVCVEGFYSHE